MQKPIIEVENLSKLYTLGSIGATTLRESLERWWCEIRGRRDSMLDTGHSKHHLMVQSNDTPAGHRSDTFWALKDISFSVEEGEVVGIIGRNGAGKSTLLKILSKITGPTSGKILIRGRVSALLEVGTGFHPDLTGRENIYLNGTILGMRKTEIDHKFDQIVAFSEIEKFIDTPVKHYSSGMYVRLAFAVAAHLDPEILLVDEVLAVGDANFQRKCLGKIGQVAKSGRTVLFISHNMAAINQLCGRVILLDCGKILASGNPSDVIDRYLSSISNSAGEQIWQDVKTAPGNELVRLHAVRIVSEGKVTSNVGIDNEVRVEVDFWNLKEGNHHFCTNLYLLDSMGTVVLSTANTVGANSLPEEWFSKPHTRGLYRTTCMLPRFFLNEMRYYITVYIVQIGPVRILAEVQQVLSFTVFDTGEMREPGGGPWHGVVRPRLPWETQYLGTLNN